MEMNPAKKQAHNYNTMLTFDKANVIQMRKTIRFLFFFFESLNYRSSSHAKSLIHEKCLDYELKTHHSCKTGVKIKIRFMGHYFLWHFFNGF